VANWIPYLSFLKWTYEGRRSCCPARGISLLNTKHHLSLPPSLPPKCSAVYQRVQGRHIQLQERPSSGLREDGRAGTGPPKFWRRHCRICMLWLGHGAPRFHL
jgi:hypothetical protein